MYWALDAVNFQCTGLLAAVNLQYTGVAICSEIAINLAETLGFTAVAPEGSRATAAASR
jgi:hypothetical protein